MSTFPIHTLSKNEFPKQLLEIPKPPEVLTYRGALPPDTAKCLAVVGSRNYTNYGKQALEYLIRSLRGHNIAIISGLALGIDSLAHKAALDAELYTLAVPGSGIDDSVIYPRRHKGLAYEILGAGGGLLSEFEPTFKATTWSFPQRNRIMAGLADAVLVVEATQKSGTLITARLATDYNRDVLTIPGDIFSASSEGPHMLIKLGATPVTTPEDILEALHIDTEPTTAPLPIDDLPQEEASILALLSAPTERDTLVRAANMDTQTCTTTLTMMEIKGLISIDGNVVRRLR
ncbi:MAG: DNA-processing protein DprA [Candidatus Pacebacteria bacterium]|nr:DNA-processing protein DprA [Candidatus Paceibacterota bacterium]